MLCSEAVSHVCVRVVFLVSFKFSVYSITCIAQPLPARVLNFGSGLCSPCAQTPELVGILP